MPSSACHLHLHHLHSFPTRRSSDLMDSVVCLNVLEHVEDDMQGLRNIHSVLRPGGRAIILVPHGQEIFGTLDVALGHYRRYSHEELRSEEHTSELQSHHDIVCRLLRATSTSIIYTLSLHDALPISWTRSCV